MWPMLGAAISAGSNVISGLMSQAAQSESNAANVAAQERANAQNVAMNAWNQQFAVEGRNRTQMESDRAYDWSREQFQRNVDLQREFATTGLRMKVADAMAAGLHPLYALGGGSTFSPVSASVGAGSYGGGPSMTPAVAARVGSAEGLARGIGAAGQDIGRAVAATQTADERLATNMTLQRMGLENELLASQIAKVKSQIGPPMPGGSDPYGVGATIASGLGGVSMKNANDASATQRWAERMGIPSAGYSVNPDNTLSLIPSKEVHDRIEDFTPYTWEYYLQNRVLPMFGLNRAPIVDPGVKLPGNMQWRWDPIRNQQYVGYKSFWEGAREKWNTYGPSGSYWR